MGIVLRRSPRQLAAEPFYGELIGGMEETFEPRGLHVLMQVVDGMPRELESYRHWARTGVVRGVVLVDLVTRDPRPALLAELGLPGIILGEPDDPSLLPALRTDGYGPIRDAVSRLAELGHRRIARVAGPATLKHTLERTRGFIDATTELSMEALLEEGDYSAETGAAATARLLRAADPPTAIVYDNDSMAIAGLSVAREFGVEVPHRLSILAWDDSQHCRLARPAVSAMSYDVHQRGQLAARTLLDVLDGAAPRDVWSEPPVLVERGSTAPYEKSDAGVHLLEQVAE
ncbi:LacI family DNA-binding transcriptional regulator [Gryllotalpicola reticulitermitis]|uniref:LacI family DNA-binding transcriptional regulator n=1 Tax=Gryllotalpicola reticulitermitis TaxID=1184153 RepID=A0ABV8QBR1_9MICO